MSCMWRHWKPLHIPMQESRENRDSPLLPCPSHFLFGNVSSSKSWMLGQMLSYVSTDKNEMLNVKQHERLSGLVSVGLFFSFSICRDVCWHQHRNSVKCVLSVMRWGWTEEVCEFKGNTKFTVLSSSYSFFISRCFTVIHCSKACTQTLSPSPSPLLSVTGPAMCWINTKWQSL